MRVDSNGDVLAVGKLASGRNDFAFDFAVVKLAGVDGAELWRKRLGEWGNGDAASVRVDGEDNVIAAGNVGNAMLGHDFFVAKFAGGDGAEYWRYNLHGTGRWNSASSVSIDGNGDVAAVGAISDLLERLQPKLVKLQGADGLVRAWLKACLT